MKHLRYKRKFTRKREPYLD